MGLYDHYEPVPRVACSGCGVPLTEWHGKDSQCCLVIWRQGSPSPVGVIGNEPDRSDQFLDSIPSMRLPSEFEIYSTCRQCNKEVVATGFCAGDTWTVFAFGRHVGKSRIEAELLDDGWRLCSNCNDAWKADPLATLAPCPNCESLTSISAT